MDAQFAITRQNLEVLEVFIEFLETKRIKDATLFAPIAATMECIACDIFATAFADGCEVKRLCDKTAVRNYGCRVGIVWRTHRRPTVGLSRELVH